MKVLHLLAGGGTGGTEILCRDLFLNAKWDNRICVIYEEGKVYEELKEKSNKIFSLKNENRNKKNIVKKIVEYCNKEKIDIITVHHGGISCNIIYIMLKEKLPTVKFVRYLHGGFDRYNFGNGKNFIKDIIVKKVMQKAFNVSDKIVFISEAVKKTFFDNFKIENQKTIVIYNGVPNNFFEKKSEINRENNSVIYVGRLVKLKGIHLLLEAFEKVYEKTPEIKLTIVGDGQERENLEKQIIEYKSKKNIDFVGRQSNVTDWLDKNGIFIYPSIGEEGFGISVVEAMSRGCIPITFKAGGLPEVIDNGENGFLVKEKSSEQLAQKILQVLNIPDFEKKEIRKKAIKKAQCFTLENTIQELEKMYKRISD